MKMIWQALAKYVTYPLWDLKDGTGRLAELRALKQSQYWEYQQIQDLQLGRLRAIVGYAYQYCGFYQARWGKKPEIRSLGDIEMLPVTTKADVASNAEGLISSQFTKEKLVEAKTGGSTGTALKVYFDEECQKKRNAAAMRSDGWAGWKPGTLIGGLWGTPPIPTTVKERIRNSLHDRIFYLDTMRLDQESMLQFAKSMRKKKPGTLFGHAHSLFMFACFLRDEKIFVPKLDGIVSTSMMLIDSERQVIENVFGVPATNRYGCEEVGLIASECELHSGMHINAEHVIVELLDDQDLPVSLGEEGRIVVTDLSNRGMPLVRYAVGDVGIMTARRCECGRGLPMLEGLSGRVADFLRRRDGSKVAGISLVEKTLTAVKGLAELQIIQEKMEEFSLNVVPSSDYSQESEWELRAVIEDVFGEDVRISVNKVARLSQERNSKYRFSICRL